MLQKSDEKNLFIETLKWICKKLESANIPYMITGGSALGFWGHIRTTMDIDIVVEIHTKNLDVFLDSIKKEAYVDIPIAKKSLIDRTMFNIIHNETCFKIDIIPLKRTEYEIEKFKNKKTFILDNINIFVSTPEDLIISKLEWSRLCGGSERQIRDCESIYMLNRKNLNLDYIENWCKELQVEDIWSNILKQINNLDQQT